ncbi:hypothetical protein ACTA71_002972 [Dictyostelium dimigraforme]
MINISAGNIPVSSIVNNSNNFSLNTSSNRPIPPNLSSNMVVVIPIEQSISIVIPNQKTNSGLNNNSSTKIRIGQSLTSSSSSLRMREHKSGEHGSSDREHRSGEREHEVVIENSEVVKEKCNSSYSHSSSHHQNVNENNSTNNTNNLPNGTYKSPTLSQSGIRYKGGNNTTYGSKTKDHSVLNTPLSSSSTKFDGNDKLLRRNRVRKDGADIALSNIFKRVLDKFRTNDEFIAFRHLKKSIEQSNLKQSSFHCQHLFSTGWTFQSFRSKSLKWIQKRSFSNYHSIRSGAPYSSDVIQSLLKIFNSSLSNLSSSNTKDGSDVQQS